MRVFFKLCFFSVRECWLPRRFEWRKERYRKRTPRIALVCYFHYFKSFANRTSKVLTHSENKVKNTPEVSCTVFEAWFTVLEVWFTQPHASKWFWTLPLRSDRRENQNEFNLNSRFLWFMSWTIIIYHKHLISASAYINFQVVKLEGCIRCVI